MAEDSSHQIPEGPLQGESGAGQMRETPQAGAVPLGDFINEGLDQDLIDEDEEGEDDDEGDEDVSAGILSTTEAQLAAILWKLTVTDRDALLRLLPEASEGVRWRNNKEFQDYFDDNADKVCLWHCAGFHTPRTESQWLQDPSQAIVHTKLAFLHEQQMAVFQSPCWEGTCRKVDLLLHIAVRAVTV